MTQGGPLQSTVSVLYFMYEEGFKWWNLGSASAVAFVLFLLIFAVTALQLRGKQMDRRIKRRLAGAAGERSVCWPLRRPRCSRCCGWFRCR